MLVDKSLPVHADSARHMAATHTRSRLRDRHRKAPMTTGIQHDRLGGCVQNIAASCQQSITWAGSVLGRLNTHGVPLFNSPTGFPPRSQTTIQNPDISVPEQARQPPAPTSSDTSLSIIKDDRRVFGQTKLTHQARKPGSTRNGMRQAALRIGKDINVESTCIRNMGLTERSVRIPVLTGQENAGIQRNVSRCPCKEVLCGKKR